MAPLVTGGTSVPGFAPTRTTDSVARRDHGIGYWHLPVSLWEALSSW